MCLCLPNAWNPEQYGQKILPLLDNGSVNTVPRQPMHTQEHNCGAQFFCVVHVESNSQHVVKGK
jgi:predicted acylesterase/phospholipase RssA